MSLSNLFRFLRPAPPVPDSFLRLFGEKPTAQSTGLRGNELRFAQGEWKHQLERFEGVVDLEVSDPALDPGVLAEAKLQGELEHFDEESLDEAERTFLFFAGEAPVFFLEKSRSGAVRLFARFIELDHTMPGTVVLEHPGLASGVMVAELVKEGRLDPPNPHPLVRAR